MKNWIVAAIITCLFLSGCSNKVTSKKPLKTTQEVTKVEDKPSNSDQYPYAFPLTGVGSKTKTDGRAVAVMINNNPKARPQSGLSKADMIYEILAEGDVTRFLAVFQSEKPGNIGPVRSARDYYIEVAKGLKALYIAHGYSPEAKQLLNGGYIDNLNGMVYDGRLFKRASFRKAPHNSYITYENILKGVDLKNYSMDATPPAFTFYTEEKSKNITGDEAKSVMISYFSSSTYDCIYEYDPSLEKYKRFSNGDQTVDMETKTPVLLDNVFIVEMNHKVIDSSGRRDIDLVSGGRAYLLQKGKVNEVEWRNSNGRIVPFKDGEEIPFVQGKTWINIVPTNPGMLKSVSFNVK